MKPVYKASDDSEHPTAKAAAHQEKIIKAVAVAKDALRTLSKLVGESALTADGQQFDLDRGAKAYWMVLDHYGMPPTPCRDYCGHRQDQSADCKGIKMNPHQSITELYVELCGKFRQLKLAEFNKTQICQHCEKPESQHSTVDGKPTECSIYATSTKFLAKTEDEFNKVEKSLLLLEQLAEVHGWKL